METAMPLRTKVAQQPQQQSPEATLSPTSVVESTPSPAASAACSPRNDIYISRHHHHQHGNNTMDVSELSVHDNDNDNTAPSAAAVAMVHGSSRVGLLPSGAASVTPHAKSKSSTATVVMMVPKPFFVMDWLEEINPRDLELARQMLQTPKKGTFLAPPNVVRQHDARTVPWHSSPALHKEEETDPNANVNAASRNSISIPTLSPSRQGGMEEDPDTTTARIRRQLYPAQSSSSAPQLSDMGQETKTDDTVEVPTVAARTSAADITGATTAATPIRKDSGTKSTSSVSSSASKMSPFRKRSIAIGNGWNAKGLQKAKKGSWESALACWENALVIRTQVLGDSHPDVANTCNNIGIALGKLGRFDAAIEILEQALEMRALHYGTREHVEVAATLHNIGNVLQAAQDYAGAIQCFWDAKLLQEQLLGANHIQVARACVAIANVYNEAFQYQDAREAYLDSLHIFANAGLPDDHPEVTAVQQDLHDVEQSSIAAYHQHTNTVYQQQWHPHYPPPAMAAGDGLHFQQGRKLFD